MPQTPSRKTMASILLRFRFSTLSQIFSKPARVSSPASISDLKPHHNPSISKLKTLHDPATLTLNTQKESSDSNPSISYTAAVSRIKPEHDPDKILSIFNSISGDPTISTARFVRELAVKRLATEQKFSEIEALLEKQKEICRRPTEKFFTSIIISYGKAKMVEQAIRTFEEMEERGVRRSRLSFNALLTACNKAKRFDQVPKLFSEIPQKFGIVPDKISYGVLVKSLCESGLVDSAHSILDEMGNKNIQITVVTLTSILDWYYKNNLAEKAEQFWVEMVEKGCSLDVTCYNVRILHSARNGNVEQVLRLMGEMVSVGIRPNVNTHNILMACYCRNNLIEDAKKVYESIGRNGCLPNKVTFRCLVLYLCKKGDFASGLDVAKQCIARKNLLNFGTLKLLIEGVVKEPLLMESEGTIGDLKWLIRVSKSWYHPHSAAELEKLEMGLDGKTVEGLVDEEKPNMANEAGETNVSDDEDELGMVLGLRGVNVSSDDEKLESGIGVVEAKVSCYEEKLEVGVGMEKAKA